jgi:hypothetical protein
MFRKIVLVWMTCSSLSVAMSVATVQTVKKEKLGCIKGLGVKRVEAIVRYRKTHTLESLDELLNVKGIGKGILENLKEDKKKKVCTPFNLKKKEKAEHKKKDIKAE